MNYMSFIALSFGFFILIYLIVTRKELKRCKLDNESAKINQKINNYDTVPLHGHDNFSTQCMPFGKEKHTILYAEDNDMVRVLTKEILSNAGYNVLSAEDGSIALKLYQKNLDKIDLCIFDIIMPGINGNCLYKIINRNNIGIPVLFLSAYSDQSIEPEYMEKINGKFIQKPYEPNTLLTEVKDILRRH